MHLSPIIADPDRPRRSSRLTGPRERILAAARELLREGDFRSLTMERTALRARLSRRSVYNHFADRQDLFRASRTALLDEFAALLPLDVPIDADPPLAIERFARDAIAVLGCAAHRELVESARRDAAADPWVARLYDDRVALPMLRGFERYLLAQALRGRATVADPAGLAAEAMAMIRASVAIDGGQPLLTPREIALVIVARLTGDVARAAPPAPALAASPVDPVQAAIRRPMIKRGALTLSIDPVELRWNDIHVPLSRLEADITAEVVRRGKVSWDDVNALLADRGASVDCRDVLIHRVRRKFAALGAADPFQTVRGWGIKLRAERDALGSQSLWIGAAATSPVAY